MIKTIKVYQAEALINQRDVDGLFYVDKVSHENYSEIIGGRQCLIITVKLSGFKLRILMIA